jgi:hypothetical protein
MAEGPYTDLAGRSFDASPNIDASNAWQEKLASLNFLVNRLIITQVLPASIATIPQRLPMVYRHLTSNRTTICVLGIFRFKNHRLRQSHSLSVYKTDCRWLPLEFLNWAACEVLCKRIASPSDKESISKHRGGFHIISCKKCLFYH